MFSYPLVAQTDMPKKMKLGKQRMTMHYLGHFFEINFFLGECQELCSSIMEKHSDNEVVKGNIYLYV